MSDNSKFTQAQLDALNVRGRNVLVSAAAGSGKTFTLTKRIIRRIIDDNADISRILVVTFTRAAASELRSRISSALSDKIAELPDNEHLQNQLLLLGGADICTIDSFLSRPVRENFDKLGLPISLRLADDTETAPIKNTVMREVMDSLFGMYGVCDDCGLSDIDLKTPYTDLLAVLSSTVKDSSDIIPYLLKLHSSLITSSRGVELLSDFSARLKKDAAAMRAALSDTDTNKNSDGCTDDTAQISYGFSDTREGQLIISELKRTIYGALAFCDKAIEQASSDEIMCEKMLHVFESDKNHLICMLEHIPDGYGALKGYVTGLSDVRFKPMKQEQKTDLSESLRSSCKEISANIAAFGKSYMSFDELEIVYMYEHTAQMIDVLYTLLSEYNRRLTEEKTSMGIYEFSDMPRLMLKLLLNADGTLTETAKALSSRYDEVYIDEYQDVNEIQDRIFSIISPNARFMVGDVKQSIYRFRDAEPTFFTLYRSTFPTYDRESQEQTHGSTIYMSNNFRSDENVIKFSNLVCSPMFRACGESIAYTSGDDLVFTKSCPEGYRSPSVTVDVFGNGECDDLSSLISNSNICTPDKTEPRTDGLSEEAVLVANRITELVRHGKKANGSNILPSDIAILVRSKSSIPHITAALKRLNIKYLVASKSELWAGQPMRTLIDLCDIIDNPRNDVPLCNILTCDMLPASLRFDIGETVIVRHKADKRLSLYDAVLSYSEGTDPLAEKCARMIKKLSGLRAMSIKLTADKLLRLISADSDLSRLTDGEEYKFMYDSACKYTKSFWNGLSGFISYFKQLAENGSISGEVAKDDNAVNIITMHYSKGLQYNTCFLFDMFSEFNTKEYSNSAIYDKDLCLGMHIPIKPDGAVNHIKAESVIRRAAALDMQIKDRQEEMRILYVAMTRAEERLFISGTLDGRYKYSSIASKLRLYGDSDISITDQKSHMAWVLGGIVIDIDTDPCYTVNVHPAAGTTRLADPLTRGRIQTAQTNVTEKEMEYASLAAFPPSQKREEIILSSVPSKVAASKVSPSMLDDSVFSDIPMQTLFSDEASAEDSDRADNRANIKNRIELLRSQPPIFDSLLDVSKKPTAAERGTATHALLQYWDVKNARENGLKNEISRLVSLGFISERTAKMLNLKSLSLCLDGELADMMLSAKNIRREFKFGIMQSADKFTKDPELAALVGDRNIFVQGSIDLIIENHDGSIYLCDYKTDGVTAEERDDPQILRARLLLTYGEQLTQYSNAIEQIFGKRPDKTFILSVPLGKLLRMDA